MPEKTTITNVHKDTRKSLTELWTEIINHLEVVKYEIKIEETSETSYSKGVQSRSCQSKNGEVSDL